MHAGSNLTRTTWKELSNLGWTWARPQPGIGPVSNGPQPDGAAGRRQVGLTCVLDPAQTVSNYLGK